MVYFDRIIPPGGEGKITLKINTRGRQGNIRKSARVISNDLKNPTETISIRAHVNVPIYQSARYVYLKGAEGRSVSRTVTIRAGLDKPLKIEPIHYDLSQRVSYKIEEAKKGKLFLIHFISIPGQEGVFHGVLKLKTNYPRMPKIIISIRGGFKKKSKKNKKNISKETGQ